VTGCLVGRGQQQGGNGRGDTVRLQTRSSSGGSSRRGERFSCSNAASAARETGFGKRGEPQGRQQDATSLQSPSGENRRGGAKPRGRNGMDGSGDPYTEGWRQRHSGVDARRCVDGGEGTNETQERKVGIRAGPQDAIRFEGDAKATRAELEQSRRGGNGKPRRPAPATEEGQGGSGKGQRPTTDADVGDTSFERCQDTRTLNAPPTP